MSTKRSQPVRGQSKRRPATPSKTPRKASPKTTAKTSRLAAGSGRLVRRDISGSWSLRAPTTRSGSMALPPSLSERLETVTDQVHRVTITGTPDAIEDYLDAREIDRRLADPENRQRIPWSELKAKRGL